MQAYESQANDDPEIGPSIDAGFVESDERVSVDSSNLNEMFPDAVLPENEPIKLLLFFTYKDPGLDRFFAEILIYEIVDMETEIPCETVAAGRALTIPQERIKLQRVGDITLK